MTNDTTMRLRSVPPYIQHAGVVDLPIAYPWNDEAPRKAYAGDDKRLMNEFGGISSRGCIALSAGMAEWIAYRLIKHTEDSTLFQVIEALWASAIDPVYIRELKKHPRRMRTGDSRGPIQGAFACAYHLLETISFDANRDMACEPWMVPLSNLVVHVLEDPKPFKSWLRTVVVRFGKHHRWTKKNPVGSLVSREDLELEWEPRSNPPELVRARCARFLAGLDPERNSFLAPRKEMVGAGFVGTPYELDAE